MPPPVEQLEPTGGKQVLGYLGISFGVVIWGIARFLFSFFI